MDENKPHSSEKMGPKPFGVLPKMIHLEEKDLIRLICEERDRTQGRSPSTVMKKILREYFARQAVKREMAADSLLASMQPTEQR